MAIPQLGSAIPLHKDSCSQVSFAEFYRAVPEARVIYNKYQSEYTDEHFEHSKWLGRWVKRAERYIAQTSLGTDEFKQEITDKLITKLVSQILVSPYDCSPFVPRTEKSPVLFKGILFPYWMLEDILKLIGNLDGLRLAKTHGLMIEMLEWSKSLAQRSQSVPTNSTAIIPAVAGGALVALNQTASATHLDSTLLVSLNFSEHPELTIIKLLAYRNLIKNAFKEIGLRKVNKGVKKQLKQIVRFGEEQKALAQSEKAQNVQVRKAHEEAISKQFDDVAQIQDSTQNIMKEHFQSLIEEMNKTEERMRKMQQDCKNKESQVKGLQDAQRNLRV